MDIPKSIIVSRTSAGSSEEDSNVTKSLSCTRNCVQAELIILDVIICKILCNWECEFFFKTLFKTLSDVASMHLYNIVFVYSFLKFWNGILDHARNEWKSISLEELNCDKIHHLQNVFSKSGGYAKAQSFTRSHLRNK